jgi:Putative translation initiation inhibitor, yjgF family
MTNNTKKPYSVMREYENIYFVSGQLPLNDLGIIVGEDFAIQAKQAIRNLRAILEQENVSINNLLKITVFLADINDYQEFNEIYLSELFDCETMPARSAFQVGALPMNAKIEIEGIFRKEQ